MRKRLNLIKWILIFVVTSVSAADSDIKVAAVTAQRKTMPRKTMPRNPALRKSVAEPIQNSPDTKSVARTPADGLWGQVNAAHVNVRSGPGTQHPILTTLNGGDFVKPIAQVGNWLEIELPENLPIKADKSATQSKAYISAKYVLTGVQRPTTSCASSTQTTPSPQAEAIITSVQHHYELTNQIEETRKLLTDTNDAPKISEKQKIAETDLSRPVETAHPSVAVEVEPQPKNQSASIFLPPEESAIISCASTKPVFDSQKNIRNLTCAQPKIEVPAQTESASDVSPSEPVNFVPVSVAAEKLPQKAIVIHEGAAPIVNATQTLLRDVEQKIRVRFVLPSDAPILPGARAEVIDPLPTPMEPAPASQRLQPQHKTQVCNMEIGNSIHAEGIIENIAASSVNGISYALMRDGRILHLLSAQEHLGLENFVGRNVTVTGVKLQSASANDSVLEVGSISARE